MSEHHELELLIVLASLIFLIAVYFSFKLSKETHHEKYWLSLSFGFLVFAFHHWMEIPLSLGFIEESLESVIEQISSIVGSVLFAYATRGLYNSMKEINART